MTVQKAESSDEPSYESSDDQRYVYTDRFKKAMCIEEYLYNRNLSSNSSNSNSEAKYIYQKGIIKSAIYTSLAKYKFAS